MQIYPMGRNNLNQLVEHQMGDAAYRVIHEVYENLDLFRKLGKVYVDNKEKNSLLSLYRKSKATPSTEPKKGSLLSVYKTSVGG